MRIERNDLDVLIGFNANDWEAMIQTSNPSLMKRLNDLVVEMPDACTLLYKTIGMGVYVLPKSFLGLKMPEHDEPEIDFNADRAEMRNAAREAMRRIALREKNANGHFGRRLDFLSDGEF